MLSANSGNLIKMAATIDSIIIIFSPLLIVVYLIAAALIWRRKVSRGENGLYAAMILSLLIIAGTWTIAEMAYLRALFELFNSPDTILPVRLFRLVLLVLAFYNLYQYQQGMK